MFNPDKVNLINFTCRICGRDNCNKLVIKNCEKSHEKSSGMSVKKILEANEDLYQKNKQVIAAMKK